LANALAYDKMVYMEAILKCSIGIMAYNEEQNIARLLYALQKQKLEKVIIENITVVSSGCTDNTENIVRRLAKDDPRMVLIVQEKREGKSSAINLWLNNTRGKILVMESADTIPLENTIENLVLQFKNDQIGMSGARPVPKNDPKTFWGFAAHLLWSLHHTISLENPKMGETVAFRNVFGQIPKSSSVDEAEIESRIVKNGFKVVYVPDAIIQNKGPENFSDFIKQRRRIYAGHLALQKKYKYAVSTASGIKIFRLLLKNFSWDFRSVIFTPFVIIAEIYGRFLGWYDFTFKKRESTIWEIAKSTKNINA
jgi:poly-beta-1,6-N-acetyl-D-glucosamine synthase